MLYFLLYHRSIMFLSIPYTYYALAIQNSHDVVVSALIWKESLQKEILRHH